MVERGFSAFSRRARRAKKDHPWGSRKACLKKVSEKNSYKKRKGTTKRNVGRRNVFVAGKVREKEDHGRRKLQKEPPVCRRHSICVRLWLI